MQSIEEKINKIELYLDALHSIVKLNTHGIENLLTIVKMLKENLEKLEESINADAK